MGNRPCFRLCAAGSFCGLLMTTEAMFFVHVYFCPEPIPSPKHANWSKLYNRRQVFEIYRFSASWLRSSRNNCSYECNISYRDNVPTILHQFLKPGTRSEACFAGPTGCPSIALPLGAAHPPWGNTKRIKSDF